MKRIEVEMLSEESNCPVVKAPGRKFPGIILQGDSLKQLYDSAIEISELSKDGNHDDLLAALDNLKERLKGFLAAYERAMSTNGLQLPYPKAISGQ
jgi:hypothetical protein